MPVNDQPREYAASLPVWLRHRDVLAGEDAVKARGSVYLACMDAMSDEDFRAYMQRAEILSVPRDPVGTLTIMQDGSGDYADPNPPSGSGFYRPVRVP